MIIQDLHTERPSLYLRYRVDGKIKENIVETYPYFWSEHNTGNESIPNAFGQKFYKKFYKDSSKKYFMKKSNPNSCQLDVSFENQYLIDYYEKLPEYEPRIWHLDIETDMGLDALKADKAITAITIWDSFENHFLTWSWKEGHKEKTIWDDDWCKFIFASEKRMLNSFIKIIKSYDPDIITGWNVIGYDIKYIINRMYRLAINPNQLSPVSQIEDDIHSHTKNPIRGRIVFDLLFGYKKFHQGDIGEKSLKAVLEDNNAPIRKGDGVDDYDKNYMNFLDYNKGDVEGTIWIDNEFGILESFLERQRLVGCKFTDTYYNKDMVDMAHLRGAKKLGFVLPTGKPHTKGTYEGAIVIEPKPGFYTNVICLDVKSMYPASTEAANMSFETIDKDGDIKLGNNVCFNSDPIGLTPSLLQDIQNLREEYKTEMYKHPEGSHLYKRFDNKQRTTKFLKNSFYGWTGYESSRLYNPDIAASITWLSRAALQHIIDFINNNFSQYEVIYGHTDSVFIKIPDNDLKQNNLKSIAKNMVTGINQSWGEFEAKYNLIPGKYAIETDHIFNSLIITGKNRYSGKYETNEGFNYKIQGFEAKKKSTSPIVKHVQENLLKSILNEEPKDDIINTIKEIVNDIRIGIYSPDEICIKKKLKQDLNKYVTQTDHVKAAKWSNQYLKTSLKEEETMIKMLIVKLDKNARLLNVQKDGRIAYETESQIKDLKINYDIMIDKMLKGKIKNIFEAMSWNVDEVLLEEKVSGFDKW